MKFILLSIIIFLGFTSCGIRGYENFIEISSETDIVGKYRISDSSVYANPNFILNLKDDVERKTSYGAHLHIDSIDNNYIHGRFESDTTNEPFKCKRGPSKKTITIKRSHHFKSYILLNTYGTNKSRLKINSDGDLLITKSNYGCAFLLIVPGFTTSEEIDFIYKKE